MPDCCTYGKKRRWKVFLAVAIFVGVLAALSAREAGREPGEYGERPGARKEVMRTALEQSLPYRLGGLERGEMVRGAAALADIAHLHGKTLSLTDATVSRYGTGVTLWVGWALSPKEAQALVGQMTESVRKGRSPFSSLQEMVSGGRTVYRLSGQGQEHVYFAAGERIIWAAADSALIQRVVEDLVNWNLE